MNCAGQQRTSDSTTISNDALRRILTAAQRHNVLKEQVDILNKRIENYQSIIQTLNERDSVTVSSYEAQIKNIQEVVAIYENQLKETGKELKKERRKRKWQAFGGLAAISCITYLYIIK